MIITESFLLRNGIEEYQAKSESELSLLKTINAIPVQRNSGIDGFLKDYFNGFPVPVKIQGEYESLEDAILKLEKASTRKNYQRKIVIQTKLEDSDRLFPLNSDVIVVKSLELQTKEILYTTFVKQE